EFWATATVHHHSIRFKMDNKKHIVNLESFRDMLHICPRLPGQSFAEPPFEEEILAFLYFLGHSGAIRKLTDVNINKLHQPWRPFAAIINKCLTEKSSSYDSLWLSQAQVEHKDTKKSNEMYYPRFTKVIIHHFMSKDPSISRRNKVNYHYVRDDHMFTTIKLVSRHQNTQQFGAMLPIELTNADIMNSNAYKEYYAVATGATPFKPKASVRKTRSSFDTTITHPTAAAGLRLSTSAKGKQPATTSKSKSLFAFSKVAMTKAQQQKLATKRSLQQTHFSQASGSGADEGTGDDDDDEQYDDDDARDDDEEEDEGDDEEDDQEKGGDDEKAFEEEEFIHPILSTHAEEETRDEENFDPISKTPENTDDKGNGEENLGTNVGREEGHNEEEEEEEGELYRDSSSVSSQFVTSMLNPTPDAGMESIFEMTSQMDVQTPTSVAPLPMSAPTLTPSTIATITTTQQAPTPPTTAPSTLLQDLPNFGSLFGFDNRLKTLEAHFSEFMQINQFAGAVFSIPGIVQRCMDQQMNEAVKVAVQIQSDRLRDEAQAENDEFLKTIDENMQKIIKEHVKEQVNVQVSKILPKIKQTVNEQLEAEILTRSSNSSKTSYVVAADLSEMELKKIFIEKIEGNKSIQRSNEQRNLYKALVEAYESDKIILNTYGDTVTLKRRRDDDADKDEEPSAGSDRGSKRRREGKEPESASAPKEKTTRSTGKSTQGCLKPQVYNFCHQEKATDYGHIKWIKDLVPRTMWIQEPIGYDKHSLWGISHCGHKRQQFYGFAVNWESARDVYSKRRIITVTELKIVEWHHYKHLDWITVRRDNDKLYKLKEGDFKRLCIQDIEDMRVEDLQLGVESYQKKLNLTKPDTYRSDLKCKEAYIAYSNPRGFIYQNKDKHNRSILTDLQVTPTKPGRMTKPYSSHRFIANCFNARNLKMNVKRFNLDPNVWFNLSFNLPAMERDIINDDDVEFFIDCATNSITDEIPHLYIPPPKVEARIIPGPMGILQKVKVNEDVSQDDHFMQGPWPQAIVYLHGEGVIVSGCLCDMKKHCIKGKLELVVGVVKSCTPNSLGDMTATLKDPIGITHYKVF
nr:hypothetical protein [Tanacetum cinerariifolium]